MAYVVLDKAFFVVHALLVLFILAGWAWRRTRPWHLGLVLLTAFSWFVLGLRYGFGYCPCTGWHWHVRYRLGHTDMPRSYLKFFIDKLTGLEFDATLVDTVAFILFGVVTLLSLGLTIGDLLRSRRNKEEPSHV